MELGEFLTNLTLDGVREGAYMLSKHSDDLLGHHARHIFRDKAASMRVENSIYYYLKDLMKKFGSQQYATKIMKTTHGEPQQLVLEAHEFRKLVASDPAFESAIPNDQVDALFHRLECDYDKLLLHRDFVEFCLLDQDQLRLLLFKFRKYLKSLDLSDIEVADTFKRLAPPDGTVMVPELFHTAIMRDLDVVLTTGELAFVMDLMDSDKDGLVKLVDLESLLKDEKWAEELIHPSRENGIVEVKISTNSVGEVTLRRDKYIQLLPKLQIEGNSSPMYLWFRRAAKEDGKAAVSDIKFAASSRDSKLVSQGYTWVQHDINRSGPFGKRKYIWTSLAPSSTQMTEELIDLSLTCGDLSDNNSARLWLPRHRGFKLVPGNLNEKNTKHSVFLWLRRRHPLSMDFLARPSIINLLTTSPRTRTSEHRHSDDLEKQARNCLRRNCPIDQDCSLNFGRLFDEFDPKKVHAITKQATQAVIETFGLKMDKKDFRLVWERMNPSDTKLMCLGAFAQFLELTDFEVDDVVNLLQRTMTTRFGCNVPNYQLIFQSFNMLGDGKLSRSDFQRIFAANQLSFTNGELSKVIHRFDVNKDGIVDYSDFLSYVTGVCDASARAARRIAEAAEEFQIWALEKQSLKLATDGNIDSASAWRLLEPKHGRLDSEAINHILRQRGKRLTEEQIHLLQVLVAPLTNGDVDQESFHAFVNHVPKKIPTMVYELKKMVGSTPVTADIDTIYNRMNVEANGKLSLINFSQQLNALAVEKSIRQIDLKDLVYVVQYTGASCGGDGAVLLDRFLSVIRGNQDRRNMKSEFGTHYDSPQFLEGVNLLRDELKRCAKTPDGKFDYMIPFRLFDKDNSGQIVLSEFEVAIRELGVDKYLNDQEVKGLMRRFDTNLSGAIDFNEFLRFNLAESSSSSNRRLSSALLPDPTLQGILDEIIRNERLTSENAEAFCGSLKRMFIIIDKDTTGFVPVNRFVETLQELSVAIPKADMNIIVTELADDKEIGNVQYERFCEAITQKCQHSGEAQPILNLSPSEILNLLKTLHQQYYKARQILEASGHDFDIYRAFEVKKDSSKNIFLSVDDFKDVLWAAGVHHPYLREELEVMKVSFQLHHNSEFNAALFRKFLSDGPSAFFAGDSSVFNDHVKRLHNELQSFLSTDKDAGLRLFSLFSKLGANRNGIMSQAEFLHLLQKSGARQFLGAEDENLLLQFLDANGDGAISYAEFVFFAKQADAKRILPDEDQSTSSNEVLERNDEARNGESSTPVIQNFTTNCPKSSTKDALSSLVAISPAKLNESPHAPVLKQIGKLNRLLNPPFMFVKYFNKYRLKFYNTRVTIQVFEKIVNKFLDCLVTQRVVYNMKNMDIELLSHTYAVTCEKGTYINYKLFLEDIARVEESAATNCANDDSSSESYGISDGEDCVEMQISKTVGPVLLQAIKHLHKTRAELHALKTLLNTMKDDLSAKNQLIISEKKIYKLLTTLSLRLSNTDILELFKCIKTEPYGRTLYKVKPFIAAIVEQVEIAMGLQKEAPSAFVDAASPSVEAKPIIPAASVYPSLLEPALAKKIYRCFLAAAQHNISGRRLLEKCDVSKTGTLSLLEFQTVLRLMGCKLADFELEAVKAALGDPTSAQINYKLLELQMESDRTLQPNTVHARNSEILYLDKMPYSTDKLEHDSKVLSPASCNHHHQIFKTESASTALSLDEAKCIDHFVGHFFSELLSSRQIDSVVLYQKFEPYDIKSTGFIFIDAFSAVMRKLDIILPLDVATTVAAAFLQPKPSPSRVPSVIQPVKNLSFLSDSESRRPKAAPPQASRNFSTDQVSVACASRQNNEVFKLDLPALDTSYYPKSKSPCSPSERGKGEANDWKCPVCFHRQTRVTATCEICASQNPISVEFQNLCCCFACGFQNKSDARTCELCTVAMLPLPRFNMGTACSPTKRYSVPPAMDGWLT